MKTAASLLIAASLTLAASAAPAQNSMEKNGMTGDSMNKEPAMGQKAKPAKTKKDAMGAPTGHDPMSKDSGPKEPMKHEPSAGKPTPM